MKKYSLFTRILMMSFILSFCISVYAFAADKEYAVSAINLIVSVTDELNVLTRNVSEGNPALDKLDASANELLTSFTNNDIYLDIFPDDISFEIIVTSTPVNNSDAKDFNTLNDDDFKDYIDKLTESYSSSTDSELLSADIYSNANSKYIVSASHNTASNIEVYTLRYYTVINGNNYYYTLQSNDKSIYEGAGGYVKDIVDSAQYTEVESSITESAVFMELFETFIGFGITVLVLGLIIFLAGKSQKARR